MAVPRARAALAAGVIGLVVVPAAPAAAFSPHGPGGALPTQGVHAKAMGKDPTVTTKARKSAKYRKTIPLATWVMAPKSKAVAKRESGGNCRAVNPSGLYRGKWQMSAGFWAGYGGKKYAARADRATCHQQDKVAYRGWLASWWHPWGG
jgi:Transglycosylase-like domain